MKKIALFVFTNVFVITLLSQNGNLPDDLKIGKHSVAEWNSILDATWGDGRSTEEKLRLFDQFWETSDAQSVNFNNTLIDWDSVRNVYRPQVEAGMSHGRFTGLMQRLCFELGDSYSNICDTAIYNTIPGNGYPIVVLRRSPGDMLESQAHFGAALTPLPDSTLLVFRVAEHHPFQLEPGDRIIGYDGVPWKTLYQLLLQMKFPVSSYRMVNGLGILDHGNIPEASAHHWLKSAGLNWHLFDTIDIQKFGETDTVHLPTSMLEGFEGPVNGNEQIAVKGIKMPSFDLNGLQNLQFTQPITWEIIDGTNVGIIYVWHWKNNAQQGLVNAINNLWAENIEGLIVDYRCQIEGDFGTAFKPAYSLLFNSYTGSYSLYRRDDKRSDDPTALVNTNYNIIIASDKKLFDRPIALLTGPQDNSGAAAYMLATHPMVRTFGKFPGGSLTGIWNGGYSCQVYPCEFKEWTMMVCDIILAREDSDGEIHPLWKDFHLDFPVWHTPEAVHNGEDAVINKAVQWIKSVSHSYGCYINSATNLEQEESVEISSVVSNPFKHGLEVWALVENSQGEIEDSVQMVSKGNEGVISTGDTLWNAILNVEKLFLTEDFYNIVLKVTDLNTQSCLIPSYPRISSAGPVTGTIEAITYDPVRPPHLTLSSINNGKLKLIPGVRMKLESLIELVDVVTPGVYFGDVQPGGKVSKKLFVELAENVKAGDTLRFRAEIYSEGIHYWTDNLEFMMPDRDAAIVQSLPGISNIRCFPNPFSSDAVIEFSIDTPSDITISVTNLVGQQIGAWYKKIQQTGSFNVAWNEIINRNEEVSPGIYICILSQNGVPAGVLKLVKD